MQTPESVLGIHRILLDFEIHKNTQSQSKKLGLLIINKKTCHLVDYVVFAKHYVKRKENEKIDKCLDLTKKLKSYGVWERQWYQ